MNCSIPFDPAGQHDARTADLAIVSRAVASIEQARGVLAWRHSVTIDEAGDLLALLAGARRQSLTMTATVVVREAGSAARPAAPAA